MGCLLPLFLGPQSIVPKTTPSKMGVREAAADKWKPNVDTLPLGFRLPAITGRWYQLADYSGHWLLLVFHRHLA